MCMYMHIWSLYCDRFVYPIVTPYMAVPVEIKHYLVAYFDRITAFEALKCRTSVKNAHCLNVSSIHKFLCST